MTGQGPTRWGAKPPQYEIVSLHKSYLLQTEILLSFISCLGDWSQTIPQVKKPDVEVLGWRGYIWSAVGRTIVHSLKTWDICGIVLCDKTAHLERPFIVPSSRCTCVMIMLYNSWYATPVSWMDCLGKGKMLTNRDVNKLVDNLREISFLCIWNISGIFHFSSWNQHFTCCVYIFVQHNYIGKFLNTKYCVQL